MAEAAEAKANGEAEPAILEPKRFETSHTLQVGSASLAYRAIAAETHLAGEDGNANASIFSVSYLADANGDAARPVTFVFNGGPGSSSMWLHMGAFGPRRVVVPPDGEHAGPPPFPLEDNAASPLDVTDLVFVDPMGTGYSRPLGKAKAEDFWGVDADAKLLVAFVGRWLTEHGRWNAPRFLAGESYGTTRVTAMADKMHDAFEGLSVNGLIFVSMVLDFHTVRFNPGNIVADLAFLPTYAATAHFHGVLEGDLEETLERARALVTQRYAGAILSGSTKDRDLAQALAGVSGVAADYWLACRMRLNPLRFRKELLRERGLTVGRLDSRYTGRDVDEAGDMPDRDASASAIDGAYVAAVKDHLSRALEVKMDRPYVGFSRDALYKWDWTGKPKEGGSFARYWPSSVNVAPALASLLRAQPHLKVLVANGYYDLATPFFAAELTLSTNGIDRERVAMRYYEAGHMMYLHTASLDALATDVRATIRSAMPGAAA